MRKEEIKAQNKLGFDYILKRAFTVTREELSGELGYLPILIGQNIDRLNCGWYEVNCTLKLRKIEERSELVATITNIMKANVTILIKDYD